MSITSERQSMLDKVRELPSLLESAVKGMNDEQLNTEYREGGWTIAQVVHHLADAHLLCYSRIKMILTEDGTPMVPYDQDKWAKLPDCAEKPIGPSLSILKGLHDRISFLLESIPESSWNRFGIHPERGEVTVYDMLVIMAQHGESHLNRINEFRAAKGR